MPVDAANVDLQRQGRAQISVLSLLAAVTVLGISTFSVYPTFWAAVVVVTAVALVGASAYAVRGGGQLGPATSAALIVSGVFLLLGYHGVASVPPSGGPILVGARFVLIAILVVTMAPALRQRLWVAVTGLVVVAATVFVVGAWTIGSFPQPDIDVFDLHVAAADTLRSGGNPYRDVAVVDTSPLAEPTDTLAYPYPPLAALIFSVSTVTLGDPRWASVLAMTLVPLLVLGLLRRVAIPMFSWIIALLVAFAANPGWPLVVRFSWTEPISLPFLVGGVMLWRRSAVASGVLIGLGFATKQYYVIALPLLLLARDRGGIRRFWSAAVTAVVLTLPAFVIDFGAAWDALVRFHLTRPPRLDGASLAGLGIDVPSVVMVLFVGSLAVWFGRQVRSGGRFMIGLGAVLSALFVLGSQAFGNYWFVVASIVLLGLALASQESSEVAL